jgi:sulfite exporter TauE/SafE
MIMLAFGLGTLPAMLATGLGAIQLNRILGRKGARLGAGLLVIIVGLLTLASPLRSMLATDAGHHQHMQQH